MFIIYYADELFIKDNFDRNFKIIWKSYFPFSQILLSSLKYFFLVNYTVSKRLNSFFFIYANLCVYFGCEKFGLSF